jgi:hypothetical protein
MAITKRPAPKKPNDSASVDGFISSAPDAKKEVVEKEKVIPLHVQLPESLMKRLRQYALDNDKSLRDVVIEMLEKRV